MQRHTMALLCVIVPLCAGSDVCCLIVNCRHLFPTSLVGLGQGI